MDIYPALDLRGGRCVRLVQGRADRETVFDDDPRARAEGFAQAGARRLHVVDLDGAFAGRPRHGEIIRALAAIDGLFVQVGGGIREEATIAEYLQAGAGRCILGTQALRDPDWAAAMAAKFPGRVALGLDTRGGRVAVEGWTADGGRSARDFVRALAGAPFGACIATDVGRDGMLAGPNLAALAALRRELPWPLIASGGVSSVADLAALAALDLAGAIIGRALYEGRLTLEEALAFERPIPTPVGESGRGGPPCPPDGKTISAPRTESP